MFWPIFLFCAVIIIIMTFTQHTDSQLPFLSFLLHYYAYVSVCCMWRGHKRTTSREAYYYLSLMAHWWRVSVSQFAVRCGFVSLLCISIRVFHADNECFSTNRMKTAKTMHLCLTRKRCEACISQYATSPCDTFSQYFPNGASAMNIVTATEIDAYQRVTNSFAST